MTGKACKPHDGKETRMEVRSHRRAAGKTRVAESKTPKNKKLAEGLSFLIEDELEKAEVVLAARSITTELQNFAEKLSTIEAKDIMPMLDSVKTTFGPQAADQFSKVTTAKVRELIGAVQGAKNAIDGEIARMEQMVNGGDGSDAAMDAAPPPPPDPAAMDGAAPDDPMAGGEAPPADLPLGDAGEVPPPEDPGAPAPATGFAGRPRKENAVTRGKPLNEENAADSSDFKAQLDGAAAFSPKCYTFAHEIADSIHNLAVGGEMRNKLTKALGHILSMAGSPDVWDDPESVADLGITTHFVDVPMAEVVRTPEVAGIVKNMRKLAHMVALKHEDGLSEDTAGGLEATPLASPLAAGSVFESRRMHNVQRLRESRNPDKMILTVFRRVFRECRDVTAAVTGTARAFNIDTADVVGIIREAKNKIREDAVPALMGVEMGQPENPDVAGGTQNPNPALMGQNPTKANPQPGKPNKPMTPADMRAAKQTQDAQDATAARTGQPNQPLVPAKQAVPVQQVTNGQQQVQPVSPQMQQQINANAKGKKPVVMPGKVMNNNNVRTV